MKLNEKQMLITNIKCIIKSLLKNVGKQNELNDFIKQDIDIEDFRIFLKANDIDIYTLIAIQKEKALLICVLFYSNLIILYDNWYLIWIHEKYDLVKYLYNTDIKIQIDPIFVNSIMKNNDIDIKKNIKKLKKIKIRYLFIDVYKQSNYIMKKINFSVKDKKKLIDCNKIEIFKTSFLKEQIMHIIDNINKHQYQYKNENKNYYLEHIDKNISELLKENKIYLKKNTKVYIYIIILLYLYISFRENLTNVYYFIIAVQKIFI